MSLRTMAAAAVLAATLSIPPTAAARGGLGGGGTPPPPTDGPACASLDATPPLVSVNRKGQATLRFSLSSCSVSSETVVTDLTGTA